MRRTQLSLLGLLLCAFVSAQQVSRQQALMKAKSFAKLNMPSLRQSAPRFIETDADTAQHKNFYIFNMADDGGFVIASGSEHTADILGYCDHGRLDRDNAPCGLRLLLDYYDAVIPHLSGKKQVRKTWHPWVEHFVTTKWGQNEPYNSLCPLYNGKRCATGCVTVAMAQAVNYTRCPEGLTETIPGYVTSKYGIKVDTLAPTTFDWGNMDTDEAARLQYYCGVSIKTDYAVGASGAYNSAMPGALKNYFGYSKDTRLLYFYNYANKPEVWDSLIYNEISNRRAVIYIAYTDKQEGHTWVISGFDNGRYYMNWGWTGLCDGYYDLMNLENVGGFSLIYGHAAVLGLKPASMDVDQAIMPLTDDDAGKPFDIYTLTGVKVRSGATSFDGLPKGVYMGGGRKVFVK